MTTTADKRQQDSLCLRALGGLLLCPVCLATGLSADQAGGTQTGLPSQAGIHAKAPDAGAPHETRLTTQLWSSRIAAPEPNEDAQTQLALKRLIRQVRSVKFENRGVSSAPQAPAEPRVPAPAPEIKPVVPDPEIPAASGAATQNAASAKPHGAIPSTLLDPNRVRDPLELAELFYLSGRSAEAVPFYQRALDRLGPDNAATEADRAWILFQLGNCLRESDGTKAQEAYAKLISRFPSSPWTEMAKAHGRILSWYEKTQPQQLLASGKP